MDDLMLQENVVSLRENLEESTKYINEICGKLANQKHSIEQKDAEICHLEGENQALRSQIKELIKQNKERETELIHFSEKLEQHTNEWMNLLQGKDYKIDRLQSQVAEISRQVTAMDNKNKRETEESLHDALIKRETQIEILKNELAAAVRDIHFCMETIEEISTEKSKDKWTVESPPNELLNMRKELKALNEKLQITEKKLKNAEDDARMKAQKFSEMIIQLRQYEAGEYGLSDAVKEIKELRKRKINSEKQLEELSEVLSKHRLKCSYTEEEKAALRNIILAIPKDVNNGDYVISKAEGCHSDTLEQLVAVKEEDNIQMKTEIYGLDNTLRSPTEEIQKSAMMNSDIQKDGLPVPICTETKNGIDEENEHVLSAVLLQKKVIDVLEENEALRNGMHEILDSIHNQDGSSIVQIESRSLERLLEALDARHISGWYHPAMRIQAQLHAVEGSNSVLREQLRILRKEEQECREQLQKSLLQIKHLKHDLKGKQEREKHTTIRRIQFSSELYSDTTQSEVMKLKTQLIHVLWVHNQQLKWNKNLTLKFENIVDNVEKIHSEMRILYLRYQEREKWLQKFQNENEIIFQALNSELRDIRDKLVHYEDVWASLSEGSNEKLEALSRRIKQMPETMNFLLESNRKYEVLQNILSEKAQENLKLKVHLEDMAILFRKSIAMMRKKQEDMSSQIASLQDMLEKSLPMTSIEELNTVIPVLKVF